MITNYLKISIRNLWRHRLYSAINLGGLAIGLAAFLLMLLYVRHEFTYDRYHANADRIYRITTELKTPENPMAMASSPTLLATVLNRDYPEVDKAVRLSPTSAVVRFGDKLLNESSVYYADQAVFSVFSYAFLAGNPAQALVQPNSAVVTESFARKYANRVDVVGRSFQCNKQTYQITGVIADPPSNSDLKVNALLSHDFSKVTGWLVDDFNAYTFVLFRNVPDPGSFDRKLAKLSRSAVQPELNKMGAKEYSVLFHSEALPDAHFSTGKLADHPKGNRQLGYLFLFLAFFVLIVALLNYVSLMTARAAERAREVGIRKANGALRHQLIGQFLLESGLMSTGAILIATAILAILIPPFNRLLSIELHVAPLWGMLFVLLTALGTTLLGGFYPALILSGYQPTSVLRGWSGKTGQQAWLRQGITLFQFTLSVAMIIGVLVVWKQMHYLQNRSLGFDQEQVLSLALPDDSAAKASAPVLVNALRQRSEIRQVSLGSGLHPDGLLPQATTIFQAKGKKRETMTNYAFIDEHFVPLLSMKLSSGRNLTNTISTDKQEGFLVNEAFVKMAGWQQPLGQAIEGFMHKGKVVGVVRNFHYRTLHNAVEPLVLIYNTFPASTVLVKVRPEHLPLVQSIWKSTFPEYPCDYSFLDSAFDAQFRKDRLMMALFNGFAILTVILSCLGLFGLVIYTTRQRTKEIGIRKVLGASVSGIVVLLSRDFLKLVAVAVLLASPIAWYAMTRWLEAFAYKITIDWWLFALADLLAVLLALFTVSFQSVKAARMNPVKSLKTE
nr:ABC transporter permease [uncultured Arsenicibacter sp.]